MNAPTQGKARLVGLTLSAAALVALVSYEGYSDRAIIPVPGDKPTIGFGTTGGVKIGDKITPPQALARVMRDVQTTEKAIARCVKVPLYQYEFDAYASLTYNIGETAFCGSTLVRKLNGNDYAAACAEISRWNKFKGRELRGLTTRRKAERAICEGKTA